MKKDVIKGIGNIAEEVVRGVAGKSLAKRLGFKWRTLFRQELRGAYPFKTGRVYENIRLIRTQDMEDFYYNEFLKEKGHIGIKVVRAIIKYRLDSVFVSNIGEISYYMLKDNLVDVYRVKEGLSVKEIVQRYRPNQLEPITEPTHPVEESQVISQFQG